MLIKNNQPQRVRKKITLLVSIFLFAVISTAVAREEKVLTWHRLFFDAYRHRAIPVEFYATSISSKLIKEGNFSHPLVIINHGYRVKNREYSSIAHALANCGYFVISIQHELPSDPKLPPPSFTLRKPVWERGVQNIVFVLSQLQELYPKLALEKAILIGHSNGGDIVMLFATEHPERVAKIISLDSLRCPFPTTNHIPILTLRGNDTKANPGVLPSSGAIIIYLPNAKHIDLCDRGPIKVKKEVNQKIIPFLK